MSRKPHPAPPLKVHKASGLYYVHLHGRRHYLGRDPAQAEVRRRRLIAESLVGGRPPGVTGRLSVQEACARYEAHAADYYRDRRQVHRIETALDAVAALYGTQPVEAFDQIALRAVRESLLGQTYQRGGKGVPYSRRYVNALVRSIQLAWRWLVSHKLAPDGSDAALRSVDPLRRGRGGRELPRVGPVPDEWVEATLPRLNRAVAAMVRLQRLTGMRPGEVVLMRRADLSLNPLERIELPETEPPQYASAVTVAGAAVWAYAPGRHKTLHRGKRRVVPLGPQAQAVLSPFLEGRDPDAYLFSPLEVMADVMARRGRKLRPGRTHAPRERYDTATYARSVRNAIRRANRKGAALAFWSPGQLRHSAATAAEDASDRDTASKLLGHETPSMTAIYSEAGFRKAAALVARLG